jgi:hypothetical protein
MTDAEQILLEMSKGFSSLYDRLGELATQASARQLNCHKRFSDIEQSVAVKSAINNVEDKAKEKNSNFEIYLVRTALATVIAGVLVVIWKIFLGHIDLIIK